MLRLAFETACAGAGAVWKLAVDNRSDSVQIFFWSATTKIENSERGDLRRLAPR
jgi:hypothetical protein